MRARQGRAAGEHATSRRARRAAAASARRLHRLERARRRGPLTRGLSVPAVVAAGVVAMVVVAAASGRLEVPAPPGVSADFARSASVGTSTDLVVRIANGSGDAAMTAEVARLARQAGIHAYEVVDEASPASETRILVHHDVPDVVAAAADLRDLIGAGVVERVEASTDEAELTVVIGRDARDPA